jgi:peptidoglycan endopeptidase LytE
MLDEVLASVYETEIAARKEELVATTEADIAQEKARAAAIKKANAVKIYVVKSGDTLGHIAKRHKVTVTQLKKWNGLKSDFLRIGQKLRIEN